MTTSRWRWSSIRFSSVSTASAPKSSRPSPPPGVQRVGLVDEEDAVERAPDRAVGLDRGLADVLADERRSVDLDEVALLEQPHRAVHLGEQPRHRRLARARIAEEDEVLARRHLGQVVLLPPRLHLEEGEQRVHLLLHRLEPDEPVELRLQLGERPRRRRPRRRGRAGPRARAPRSASAGRRAAGGAAEVLDRVRGHESTSTRAQRSSSARCSSATCCSRPGDALLERTCV